MARRLPTQSLLGLGKRVERCELIIGGSLYKNWIGTFPSAIFLYFVAKLLGTPMVFFLIKHSTARKVGNEQVRFSRHAPQV